MDNTQRVIEGLRSYILDNPKERQEVVDTLDDIASKLESGELSIIEMSKYIKMMKTTHAIAVYEIFARIYRAE